jgi:hypothetical protein
MANTISSLAVLKVNWDIKHKDYLETFVPFIATIIKKINYDRIIVENIIRDFESEYGLKIPYHPMVSILERCRRRGIIKRKQEYFVQDPVKVAEYEFSSSALEQNRKFENVITEFINYVKNNFKKDLSKDQAEHSFILFLKEHDIEILFATENPSVLPEVKDNQEEKYFIYSFIKYIHLSNPQLFEFVLDIAVGHILASTILYNNFAKFYGKLKGIDIYIDTPLIFRFLGVQGPECKILFDNFFNILNEHGAKLKIFRHNYNEVIDILEECERWIENPNYDPARASAALRYFKENNFTSSDIERILVNFDQYLKPFNILIEDVTDKMKLQRFEIDEAKLQEVIVNVYTVHNPSFEEWKKEKTIHYDVNSISGIYLLRRGHRPRTIKESIALLITTNYSLAKAAKMFDSGDSSEDATIPTCLTDTFLGTILWLQSPATLTIVNERKILADCYAALQPDKELIKKYVAEIDKLKKSGVFNEEEVYLLRTHRIAFDLLMEKTYGDLDNFSDKTPQEIFEAIRNSIINVEEQKLNQEKESHRRTILELQGSLSEKANIESGFHKLLVIISKAISFIVYSFLILITIIILLLEHSTNLVAYSKTNKLIIIVVSSLFSLFGILGLVDFKNLRKKLENKVHSYLYRHFSN